MRKKHREGKLNKAVKFTTVCPVFLVGRNIGIGLIADKKCILKFKFTGLILK
jgi:hypothetical protein